MNPITPSIPGVNAAVLTPLKADLSIDHEGFADHCWWLLSRGCHGLAIFGTTGEANSLTVSAKMAAMDHLVEAGIDMSHTLPGTGMCAIGDTVAMTRHAVDLGASGVVMLPPFYYKGVSDEGIFAAYSEVIERVGDDRLKVLLYHFPAQSQTPISKGLIERLLKRYPNTVIGMKNSSGDIDHAGEVIDAFPGFAVLAGWDHGLRPILRRGGAGCITAAANLISPVLRRIYDNPEGADADEADALAKKVRLILTARPPIAAMKAVMAHHGDAARWQTISPPLHPLNDAEAKAVIAELGDAGFDFGDG